MDSVAIILQSAVSAVTLVVLLYGLWRMVQATTEARIARLRLEQHVNAVAIDIRKVELATNSMKDALVASTARASHLEGEKAGVAFEQARTAKDAP